MIEEYKMEKTWFDTFTKNAALEKHAVSLIMAMDEKRKADSEYDAQVKANYDRMNQHYVDTVRMLLNLKPNTKV